MIEELAPEVISSRSTSIYRQEPTDLLNLRSLISHKFWTDKHESSNVFCSWVPYCCGQPLWYHNTGCSVNSGGKGHRTSIFKLWPNKHLIINYFTKISIFTTTVRSWRPTVLVGAGLRFTDEVVGQPERRRKIMWLSRFTRTSLVWKDCRPPVMHFHFHPSSPVPPPRPPPPAAWIMLIHEPEEGSQHVVGLQTWTNVLHPLLEGQHSKA